jgi:fructose-1,6-bisphosphatase II
VLAAAALRCVGGDFQGVLKPRSDDEAARARRMGISDLDHVFSLEELATGDVMFAATGVTDGFLLRGVRFLGDGAETHSMVTRSRSGTVRFIRARHKFQQRPNYAPGPPRVRTMR